MFAKLLLQERIAVALGPGWVVNLILRVNHHAMAGDVPEYSALACYASGDKRTLSDVTTYSTPEKAYIGLLDYLIEDGMLTRKERERLLEINPNE